MTKVLHTGDWHGDKSLLGVSRYEEVENAVEQTIRTAIDEKVDLYLFTGDLCDPDDGPLVIRNVCLALYVAKELSAAGITSYWVTGNHDVVEDGHGLSTLSPLALVGPLVRLFDRPMVWGMHLPQFRYFVALPYVARNRAYDAKRFLEGDEVAKGAIAMVGKDVPVLLATHLTIPGAVLGDETTEMARGRDVDLPWDAIPLHWRIVAGHYHRRQVVGGPGGRKAYVCGALARHSFGEQDNEPGFSLFEI
jgi:DNA repair exonuclease SbcCD nuclease subunit